MNPMVEALAAIEHDQWVYWSKNLAATGDVAPERVERWRTLWVPYADLPEEMKEDDRRWARSALGAVAMRLGVSPLFMDGDFP